MAGGGGGGVVEEMWWWRRGVVVLVLSVWVRSCMGKELLVGGKEDAWKMASTQAEESLLNKWAERSRFLVGDTLVWRYEKAKDSVVEVKREAYIRCNASEAMAEYKDGNTKVTLDRSGPYYFISGEEGHCQKGQKLIVVVMSQRHRYSLAAPAPSPTSQVDGPAVAPTSAAASPAHFLPLLLLPPLLGYWAFLSL